MNQASREELVDAAMNVIHESITVTSLVRRMEEASVGELSDIANEMSESTNKLSAAIDKAKDVFRWESPAIMGSFEHLEAN